MIFAQFPTNNCGKGIGKLSKVDLLLAVCGCLLKTISFRVTAKIQALTLDLPLTFLPALPSPLRQHV